MWKKQSCGHGGEAAGARDAYINLSASERDALIAFVNSL